MKHYGLIGEKLGHSVSQPIHEAIFRELGIDADYRIIEIPRPDFTREASALLTSLDGFNITIPYKQDIMPLLGAIDPAAREAMPLRETEGACAGRKKCCPANVCGAA